LGCSSRNFACGKAHQAQTQRPPKLALARKHSCQLLVVRGHAGLSRLRSTGSVGIRGGRAGWARGPEAAITALGKTPGQQTTATGRSHFRIRGRAATGTNRTLGFQCVCDWHGQAFFCSWFPRGARGSAAVRWCVPRAPRSPFARQVSGRRGKVARRRDSPRGGYEKLQPPHNTWSPPRLLDARAVVRFAQSGGYRLQCRRLIAVPHLQVDVVPPDPAALPSRRSAVGHPQPAALEGSKQAREWRRARNGKRSSATTGGQAQQTGVKNPPQ